MSMERIGTSSTSKENRKVFKRTNVDSDSESSDNEACPKISKISFSTCLVSEKILNLITSSQSLKSKFIRLYIPQ